MAIRHLQPPFTTPTHLITTPKPYPLSFRRNLSVHSKPEPKPVFTSVESFAPATVANLGPGFDFLGCAVDGVGDYVTLTINPNIQPGRISITQITTIHNPNPNPNKLSKKPNWNCAGIAAISVMKKLRIRSVGMSLSIKTGLPIRSGLGSSAASAAAAAVAVNEMFGGKLPELDLVKSALEAEAKLSGYHADNVAPAIMGGFVLIRSYDPLELVSLKFPQEKSLWFVLASLEFEARTRRMRAVLPGEVTVEDHVWNCSQAAALVAGVLVGDVVGLGKALSADKVVEPRRGTLIPGMEAYGCTISGSGPTVVAVTNDEEKGREIGERMVEAFREDGKLKALAMVKKLDTVGARVINTYR
ncbi:homoserine kinase-like isoform X2 [Bidens hawaiensis]|uniref:homoserine kinase-like isoform X2 n=1 Tax=Bidens hawaiensis TaxID=980011 RepID=UPI00404930A2